MMMNEFLDILCDSAEAVHDKDNMPYSDMADSMYNLLSDNVLQMWGKNSMIRMQFVMNEIIMLISDVMQGYDIEDIMFEVLRVFFCIQSNINDCANGVCVLAEYFIGDYSVYVNYEKDNIWVKTK